MDKLMVEDFKLAITEMLTETIAEVFEEVYFRKKGILSNQERSEMSAYYDGMYDGIVLADKRFKEIVAEKEREC